MTKQRLIVHDDECVCEECATPVGILVARHGFDCRACGHHHDGESVAYVCIGCLCEKRPDWFRPAAVASAR